MSQDFAFSDLSRVHWGSTLKLALSRSFASGIVWAIIFAVTGHSDMGTPFYVMPLIWPLLALPLAATFHFLGMILRAIPIPFVPLLGLWFQFIGSLLICLGDPLVYLINRSFPALLNIADLGFFNFRPMIFITYPD